MKRKPRKRKGNAASGRPSWDDEYDPLRPIDYDEWKAHVKSERERLRNEFLKSSALQQHRESSFYSEDENDEDVPDSSKSMIGEKMTL